MVTGCGLIRFKVEDKIRLYALDYYPFSFSFCLIVKKCKANFVHKFHPPKTPYTQQTILTNIIAKILIVNRAFPSETNETVELTILHFNTEMFMRIQISTRYKKSARLIIAMPAIKRNKLRRASSQDFINRSAVRIIS